MMTLDQALERIKKCLALSKSANEHEAATALRQATALMRRFNLEHSHVLASEASEAAVRSRAKSRPPQWEGFLVSAVAHQLQCAVVMESMRGHYFEWVFIGKDHKSEIAAYALEVLLRQVRTARAVFLKTRSTRRPAEKRRLGNHFCVGWVASVHEAIRSFSGKADEMEPEVEAYLASMDLKPSQEKPAEKRKSRKPKTKITTDEAIAFHMGAKAGEKVQLRHAVSGQADEQRLIEF